MKKHLRLAPGALTILLAWIILACKPFPIYPDANEVDSVTVPPQHISSVFDIANEEYKAANFEAAIRLYEGLLSGTGPVKADIQYNIGNAYYRLNNYGKAIASYRRALRAKPRDQDIIANLKYVRDQTRDQFDHPKSAAFFREIFFFHYDLNFEESEIVFMLTYLVACFLATLHLLRKSNLLRGLSVAAAALALVMGASMISKWRAETNPRNAVVVIDETVLHTGPGKKYMVSFTLHDGAELELTGAEEGWRQVELPDGRRGWLRDSDIDVL